MHRADRPNQSLPCVNDGRTDQCGHVGVAADNPVERDDIGRLDIVGKRHEVAVMKGQPTGMALAFGFLSGSVNVRTGGIHRSCVGEVSAKKLVRDRAHSATDIEQVRPATPSARNASSNMRVVFEGPRLRYCRRLMAAICSPNSASKACARQQSISILQRNRQPEQTSS